MDPLQLKDAGNAAYAEGDWDEAIEMYSRALKASEENLADKDRAVLLKNRAMARIKNEDFEDAVKDCDEALELVRSRQIMGSINVGCN